MEKKNKKVQKNEQKQNAGFSLQNVLNSQEFKTAQVESEKVATKKHSIYKESIFVEGVKKSKIRNALRKDLKDFVSKFFASKTEQNATNVMDSFLKHYKDTYVLNDFSVNSVSTSEQTKQDKNLILFLNTCQQYNESK